MFLHKTLILSIITLTCITVRTQDVDISNFLDGEISPIQNLNANYYYMDVTRVPLVHEKVDIKLYYECHCPDCRLFDTVHLTPTVQKLASYLNLHLYPYGNAQTIDHGNGRYEFKCQHGPEECYGNKLHACAIEYLGNVTKAVFYNSCMMDPSRKNKGSDDQAADECGLAMNIESLWIKQCAKSSRGTELLKYYGDESKKVGFKFVPYILINGVQNDGSNFFKDVCAAFKTPPAACSQFN